MPKGIPRVLRGTSEELRESYLRELEAIEEILRDGVLKVTFGESYVDSKVEVNGEELSCYGVDVSCHGGEYASVTLHVASDQIKDPIVVEGLLYVESARVEKE